LEDASAPLSSPVLPDRPSARELDELEFFAKFQTLGVLQIDLQVGVSGIAIGACSPLLGEVHAVFTSEAELEARRLLSKP